MYIVITMYMYINCTHESLDWANSSIIVHTQIQLSACHPACVFILLVGKMDPSFVYIVQYSTVHGVC